MRVRRNELCWGLSTCFPFSTLLRSALHSGKLTSEHCVASGFYLLQPIGPGRPISGGGRRTLGLYHQPLLDSCCVPSSEITASPGRLFSLCDKSPWVQITAPSPFLKQWFPSITCSGCFPTPLVPLTLPTPLRTFFFLNFLIYDIYCPPKLVPLSSCL